MVGIPAAVMDMCVASREMGEANMRAEGFAKWSLVCTAIILGLSGCRTKSAGDVTPSPTAEPTRPEAIPSPVGTAVLLLSPTPTLATPTLVPATVAPPLGSIEYSNPQRYRVVYIITVRNRGFGLDQLRVYQPRPVEWNAQRDVQIDSVSPQPQDEGSDPTYGNGMYHWRLQGEPAPGEAVSFEVSFSLTAYETTSRIDPEEVQAYDQESSQYELYTRSERFIEAADPRIREIADRVAKGETNPYVLARRFYNYVIDTADYKLLGEGLRGAMALVDTGVGECGDYAALFVALCRAAGVPARPVVGFWAKSGVEQTHVWAEFFVEPFGWVPVDPTVGQLDPGSQAYYFGGMDNKRIILNKGYNLELDPPGPGGFVAPLLQAPLWWYWGSEGSAEAMRIKRTSWEVERLP